MRLVLEGEDAAGVARHIAYYAYIQRARAAIIAELRRQGDSLLALEREAVARRGDLAQNEAAQAAEATRLERGAPSAQVVARISGDIARGRRRSGAEA